MKKKSISMLLVTALVLSSTLTFAGCGKSNTKTDVASSTDVSTSTSDSSSTSTSSSTTDSSTEQTTPKFTGVRIFKDTNAKVKTLNPQTYESTPEANMMRFIYGSFTEYMLNDKNEVEEVAVMAKELPTISEDKKVYTYKLKENLKFSDGTPIDTDTYMYSYKMLLDPVMKNYRANVFFSSTTVKNAENYFNGKCKWEDVGIKALDKYTLQFTLEFAVPTNIATADLGFSALVHPALFEKCLSADKKTTSYGTTLEKTASYGPYTLKEWKMDQSYKLEKNKDYPMVEELYTPDVIDNRVVEEASAIFQLFEKGDVDVTEIPPQAYDKYKDDPRLVYSPSQGISQMNVNSKSEKNPILKDVNFRKALFYGIDRENIAKNIVKTAKPAAYFITDYFTAEEDGKIMTYRETKEGQSNALPNNGFDKKLAKEYFDKAYAANGNKKVTIKIEYADSSDSQKARSEFLKNSYEDIFGKDKIEVKLQAVPWQVSYENMENGNYDIGYAGWNGGLAECPELKFEPYLSNYQQKCDAFTNKEFDELYNRCAKGDLVMNPKGKLEATAKMEKMLLDDATIIPIFEGINTTLYSDKLILRSEKFLPKVGFATYQSEFTR